MNSKCQSRAGRPEKVHGSKGNKADKTKLLRLVENLAENLGRAPDSWSLKNEWTLIYREYFGTKTTRSFSKLRALYDCYRSSKRKTDKEREEDLRDEEDKGFLSTARPIHEDCKSKCKELKEDGVIGQEKQHELTEQEYTKQTEENLQTEESAAHVRTVRLNHGTDKECGEGLKNEDGKELLVTATLIHENDKSKIKELMEDGVIRKTNQQKLAEQEYNKELDGNKQNEENTEHFTTVPLDHNDENYTVSEGRSSTEREESYNESVSHYKHKQSKRMRFNENTHLAEERASRNLCYDVNFANSKGARNKNMENSYRLDHRRVTDTSSKVNLGHGIPNKSISSQNNTGQSSLPKRANIQPKTKPAVLVKRIRRPIKQVPQESNQKERERVISNYVSNICASIAVECSHLLSLPLPQKASDINDIAGCQEFGAKQLYSKDEKAQPCSPIPTESSLETLTNEDNDVKNDVEFVAHHHDSNSKKLYGKYDNGQTYFPDTRNTSFEESDDDNDQYDVKRDSIHIDHHQELSAKEISGEHQNPQPCFPVRKETSLEGSNSDVGDNDDSKTNANFCERNIFDESGFPSDVVESMCRARIPTTGLFKKTFDNRHFQIPISQSKLGEFPVITSKRETRFGGGWVAFLKKCLEKVNRYCVWVLKRNRLRKEDSRKKCQGNFFTGKAVCKKPECPCTACLEIHNKVSPILQIIFSGNVKHDITTPTSSKDADGSLREAMQKTLSKNWSKAPGEIYRDNLIKIPSDVYASGNRSVAGTLKKAQHAKSSMRLQSSKLSELYQLLLEIDKEQKDEDERKAVALGHDFRLNSIKGYIQGITLDNIQMRLVLFDDPMLRLFHTLATRDILYLDATGNIVAKIRPFNQIYYYSLTVRHPFGLAPPIPVGEYITSSHTTDSLLHFLMTLREKENIVFQGSQSKPKLLVCDMSIPLYASALMEFTKKTVNQYLNRAYKIVTGNANEEELNLMMIHICSAHAINSVKRKLIKINGKRNGKVHFGLRFYGRLISCYELDECESLVKHAYKVFTSMYTDGDVRHSLEFIQDSINTFLHHKDDQNDDDDISSAHSEDQDEDLESEIGLQEDKNAWANHWNNVLDKLKEGQDSEQLHANRDADKEENQYYMPDFFEYMEKQILPIIAMLSNMCLGDMRHLSQRYDDIFDLPKTTGARNYLMKNTTNAPVEKFFAVQKSNKSNLKVPLEMFLKNNWNHLQGLQRQFWDGMMQGINEKRNGTISKKELKSLKRTFEEISPESSDQVQTKKAIPEEKWGSSQKKKTDRHSTYLRPPKTKLNFSPSHPETPKQPTKQNSLVNGFSAYKSRTWKEVFKETGSPTIKACLNEVKRLWSQLTSEQRQSYTSKNADRLYCICKQPYSESGPTMVACDLCDNWFHIDCIETSEEYIHLINFYHCTDCICSKYLQFAQYIHHFNNGSLVNNDIIEINRKWMEKSSILQSSIGCHQYPTPTDYSAALHGRSRVQSQNGLANPNNNCWLNAVLHVVCGTFIYDMISELLESKDIVMRCLNEVHKYLTKNKDSRRRETCLPNAAIQLTEMLNLNIEERQHEDVCDFYDKLLGYVSEKSKQMQPNPLDSQYLNLRTCQQCLHHEGEIASHNYISVKALNTREEVSLTSLLWEKCTGQYSTTKEMRECGNCKSRNKTSPGYHELTFIQKCPVIFSVLINRTDKDMSRVCSSPVRVPLMIDLSKLSVQYDKKEICEYVIIAVINLSARSVRRGHFTVTLFDSSFAFILDDLHARRCNVNERLTDEEFMKSCYVVFYIVWPWSLKA